MECCDCIKVSPQLIEDDEFSSCRTTSFYYWLLQFLLLLGVLTLCLWLMVRPTSPQYTILDLSVPTTTNGTTTSLAGNMSYYLEIKNPNTDSSIYFDEILLTFFNGQEQDRLATDTIPSYKHPKGKTIVFSAHPVVVDPSEWKSLLNAIANGTVELKIGLATRFQYNTYGRKSKQRGEDVEGKVAIGKNGKISRKIKLTHKSKKRSVRK